MRLKKKSKKLPKNSRSIKIFNGKAEAGKISFDLKKRIKKEKIKFKIAVISVGRNPASDLFVKNKKRAAKEIGIEVLHYKFERAVRKPQGKRLEKEIIGKIEELNKDSSVNGIIVQLPLPGRLNAGKIIGSISLEKDVDGFQKKTYFSSPLISAILIALKTSTKNFKGKKITALVNSDIFGENLKRKLKKKKIKISYILRKKVSQKNLRIKLKSADIIITVCGYPSLIKGSMVKEGVNLIDGGIVLRNKKVRGDVDRESVKNKASFLTPVPGGIGPLTVALLLKNVYLTKKYHYGNR